MAESAVAVNVTVVPATASTDLEPPAGTFMVSMAVS